ncbi:hypothetical protein OEZ86_002297 [Tetradesmus obliquus]|nr:hypothetical protein OEZ86_002297 [Tetradesmus obliquus]
MIDYSSIFQTGIQSLLAVACGWGCGRWGVLQPDPTVVNVNTLVLKFCIPCLQVHLLAIKTDMRQPGSWSALLAFLAWSMGLQALLAASQLLRQGRLQYAQLGVDSLLLTTNNTGILGPVVLLAALGPEYAPLGMLATQQQQQQQQGSSCGAGQDRHSSASPVLSLLLKNPLTAFVVCKQADTGTHAISVLMVASLLVMLPQLMVLLAVLEWFGVF